MSMNLRPAIGLPFFIILVASTAWPQIRTSSSSAESYPSEREESGRNAEDLFSMSLEEILVQKVTVASMFEDRDLDVGSTVYSKTSQAWRKEGAIRTFDAIRSAPSTMVYNSSVYSAGPTVATRGFNDLGQVPSISLLWDGVNLSSIYQQSAILARPNIDLGVLDRIEMVVGPSSALYGSDALHGVISLSTPDVTKKQIFADAGAGTLGVYRGEVKYADELFPKLFVGVSAGFTSLQDLQTTASYQDLSYNQLATFGIYTASAAVNPSRPQILPAYVGGGAVDQALKAGFLSTAAVAKVRYHKTEAGLYWSGYNSKGFPGPGVTSRLTSAPPPPAGPVFTPVTASGGQYNQDSSLWMGKLAQEFSLPESIDLAASLYYWKGSSSLIAGNSNGPVDSNNSVTQSFEDWRTGFSLVGRRQASENFPTKVALGYSLDATQISKAQEIIANYIAPGNTYQANMAVNGKYRSINALFIETDTALFDKKFHLLADIREDIYNDFGGHLSPRGGVIYHPDEHSALKLYYSHAFRAPSAQELLGNPAPVLGNSNLIPDVINTVQLQYMKNENRWSFSITPYMSYWDNLVSISTDIIYQNSRQTSTSYGLELAGKYTILSNLRINGSASYVRSFGAPAAGFGNASYVLFPTYIVNWGIDYDIPSVHLSISLFNRHQLNQGRYYFSPTETGIYTIGLLKRDTIADYFRTDLGVTWDFGKKAGKWQLFGNITNLFNIRNFQPAITPSYFGQIPEPGINGQIGIRASL